MNTNAATSAKAGTTRAALPEEPPEVPPNGTDGWLPGIAEVGLGALTPRKTTLPVAGLTVAVVSATMSMEPALVPAQ